MVSQSRRPLGKMWLSINNIKLNNLILFSAERVEDIGAWYGILKIITYIAVVSNVIISHTNLQLLLI
jgi:hypothetical protein